MASAFYELSPLGDAGIGNLGGRRAGNTFLFQPALPMPAGKGVLIIRPVLPIASQPVRDAEGLSAGPSTGLGDIQMLALYGRTTPKGVVYAGGGTFRFPTASAVYLGQGKWQAGPSAVLAKIGRAASFGISVQHWWSYAGDMARANTRQTDVGYFLTKPVKKVWAVGTSPTVSINWYAADGNRLAFPIGFGVSKMVRMGATPVRIRVEVQYYLIRPEPYGTEWNFRLQVVPVIKSPFAR